MIVVLGVKVNPAKDVIWALFEVALSPELLAESVGDKVTAGRFMVLPNQSLCLVVLAELDV